MTTLNVSLTLVFFNCSGIYFTKVNNAISWFQCDINKAVKDMNII